MGRNTTILQEIITTLSTELDDPEYVLDTLEAHFHDRLVVDVGDVNTVATYAEQLRLHITEDERSVVLDYIAEQKMVLINIDVIETAINELFEDRFIEP